MKDDKDTFNVLASVEKHIEALKPLLPRQAIVCVGEYPIKAVLRDTGITKDGAVLILIDKSSDEIYKWIPRGFRIRNLLGFEDQKIETHFWYNVLPSVINDERVIEILKKKSLERFQGALIFSSVWDGIGSASLPTLIEKFKASNINSLAIAVLPSKIQPTDAHFNAYAALKRGQTTDGATILLIERDQIESYEGVDRQGEPISGTMVANYIVNLFLAKETLADEVTELSRTFNSKLFSVLLDTGASFKVFGTLENMLNTSLLKPLLSFDLSTASLLYVLLRMPLSLKDKLPRGKIELAIAKWFKDKANLKSIYVTEPVYTDDMNDRVDVALLIGGFDTTKLFCDLEKKVQSLKKQATDKGLITEILQVAKVAKAENETKTEAPANNMETSNISMEAQNVEIKQTIVGSEGSGEAINAEVASMPESPKNVEESKVSNKPKRARRTKSKLTI
jgi:hypothetical protein